MRGDSIHFCERFTLAVCLSLRSVFKSQVPAYTSILWFSTCRWMLFWAVDAWRIVFAFLFKRKWWKRRGLLWNWVWLWMRAESQFFYFRMLCFDFWFPKGLLLLLYFSLFCTASCAVYVVMESSLSSPSPFLPATLIYPFISSLTWIYCFFCHVNLYCPKMLHHKHWGRKKVSLFHILTHALTHR